MAKGVSVSGFVNDFALRLKQLEAIASGGVNDGIWLGGLFQPEAYITATRQAVAHAKGWSLETLVLSLDVEEASSEESFTVTGELRSVPPRRIGVDAVVHRLQARWSGLERRKAFA
jgi:dynein heavy chain 1